MRITGGTFRSRALRAPSGNKTRPTSDRVREALFSILGVRVELSGARVLDLYAGTGALAFEALSRGAVLAVLVERDLNALEAARANVDALKVQDRVRVVGGAIERAAPVLAKSAPYDLVFADPPYAAVAAAATSIAALAAASLFTPDAHLVLEHASADPAPRIAGFALGSSRRYGDTQLSFYDLEIAARE